MKLGVCMCKTEMHTGNKLKRNATLKTISEWRRTSARIITNSTEMLYVIYNEIFDLNNSKKSTNKIFFCVITFFIKICVLKLNKRKKNKEIHKQANKHDDDCSFCLIPLKMVNVVDT